MPQIDGQLKNAQLEEISATSTTPASRSRIYSDISDTSNAILRYYNGTGWLVIKTLTGYYTSKNTTYTATSSDEFIDCNANSASFTVTLPTAVGISGKAYIFKKSDSSVNTVTIDGSGSETIDGSTTKVLYKQYDTIVIVSNGADWNVVSTNDNYMSYIAKTATYTAVVGDDLISCDSSGAALTINLPTAVGITGKSFTIRKSDSTFATANAITVDASGSETIDGATTTTLNTQYESITIVSDGANWVIVDRKIPSIWTSFTPTGSFSTNTTYTGFWRRVGDSLEIQLNLAFSGAPAGSSTMNFPSGLTLDTAKFAGYSDIANTATPLLGIGYLEDDSAGASGRYACVCILVSTSTYDIWYYSSGGSSAVFSTTSPFTIASGDRVNLRLTGIPISGWKA